MISAPLSTIEAQLISARWLGIKNRKKGPVSPQSRPPYVGVGVSPTENTTRSTIEYNRIIPTSNSESVEGCGETSSTKEEEEEDGLDSILRKDRSKLLVASQECMNENFWRDS